MADDKEIVVEFLKSKSAAKSKFYFKDFLELFPDKGPRDVKKILTKLINEEVLEFWSSGSTSMYGLKGAGKQSHAEGEDEPIWPFLSLAASNFTACLGSMGGFSAVAT